MLDGGMMVAEFAPEEPPFNCMVAAVTPLSDLPMVGFPVFHVEQPRRTPGATEAIWAPNKRGLITRMNMVHFSDVGFLASK